ncbi:MAG: hypothetical protein WD096_03115 [Actinomycetota bacterium]
MRRPVKIVVWTLVFAASAGVGAYVASRTDPFPPGVTDPGARPTPTSAAPTSDAPPSPAARRWRFSARVTSVHELHVGGACRSDWDVQAVLHERPNGHLAGSALATLRPGAGCDFPTADVQSETIFVRIVGRIADREDPVQMVLHVRATGEWEPLGSKDLGAFLALLPDVEIRTSPGSSGSSTGQATDGNDGTYQVTWRPTVRCVAAC